MEMELGAYYVRKYDRAKGNVANWESLWQDAANYTIPQNNDIYNFKVSGERKTHRLYDSTGVQSNKLLASALHGMMTSPTSFWFDMEDDDQDINQDHEVRLWFDDTVGRMFAVLNSSNFQTQIHETYLGLGSIGTTVLFMGEHPTKTIYFKAQPIYLYTIEEDQYGYVTEVGYEEEYTYKQLVDEYGEDKLDHDTKLMGQSKPEMKFKVVVVVEPNKDYDPKQPAVNTNKPIRTVHTLRRTKTVIKEGGFDEMPYAVPRWNKFAGEKYGRGPGTESLPDNKMVNAMMKVNIRGAQKTVDPTLVVPDHGFALPLDTRPGGTIYKRQGIQDKIEPLLTGARPDIGEDMMESTRRRIRQAFYIDQLQLVQQNNMTATEVMQRTEENLRLMGPILSRLNDELLKPIIERLFGIMSRKGMLMPAPEILKGRDIKIRYVSQIAKAQRASETESIGRVIGTVAPLIQANPELMDNFEGDVILRDVGNIYGLPAKYFKKESEVGQARKARAEAAAEAEEAQLRNTDADTEQKMAAAEQQVQ